MDKYKKETTHEYFGKVLEVKGYVITSKIGRHSITFATKQRDDKEIFKGRPDFVCIQKYGTTYRSNGVKTLLLEEYYTLPKTEAPRFTAKK